MSQLTVVRNPLGPFCAVRSDLVKGVEIVEVNLYTEKLDYFIVEELVEEAASDVLYLQRLHSDGTRQGTAKSLYEIGVEPNINDQKWSSEVFTIVNSQFNRIRAVRWLVNEQSNGAVKVAMKMIQQYLDEFIVVRCTGTAGKYRIHGELKI